VRKAIAEVTPELPIDRVGLLSEQVSRNVDQDRLIAALTAVFGCLALGLASCGLFGVMSYRVARRTAELGIRVALGARQVGVLLMVFREALAPVVLGLVAGVPVVFAASRLVAGMLFAVDGKDPVTIVGAAAVLVGAGVLASRRAGQAGQAGQRQKAWRSHSMMFH
jgi:ABC-type antimicrobial peptide transport system permease subunit